MRTNRWRYFKGAFIPALCFLFMLATLLSLEARERKSGAMILVQKRGGPIIRGELLSVQGRNLILMDFSRNGVTVSIDDILSVIIEKKSKFLEGMGIGFLSGAALGGAFGFLGGDRPHQLFFSSAEEQALLGGIAYGVIGTVIGGVGGLMAGVDKSVNIPPGSEDLKLKALKNLAAVSKTSYYKEPSGEELPEENIAPKEKDDRKNEMADAKTEEKLPIEAGLKTGGREGLPIIFSRFHITLESGYVVSQGAESLKKVLGDWGFGDTFSGEDLWGESIGASYPHGSGRKILPLKKVQVEYSLRNNISVGLAYYPLASYDVEGWKFVKYYYGFWGEAMTGIDLTGKFQGRAYYLLASFWPLTYGYTQNSAIKISAGIGLADLRQEFTADSSLEMKKRPISLLLAAEYDFFLNQHVSLGVDIDYQYIPLRIDEFPLTGHYDDTAWGTNYRTSAPVRVDLLFPGARVNVGSLEAGLNLGFHF